MYTADPKQVGKLAEPVILMNTETGLCHSIETIEILDRCLNESMKLMDRKTGRSRLMQIYRDATPAEIEAWEKLGRKKRGERDRTVAESRIRNAPAVVMVNQDSPAAAAAAAANAKLEADKIIAAANATAAKIEADAKSAAGDVVVEDEPEAKTTEG